MHGACYRKGNGQPYANTRHIKGKPQIKIANLTVEIKKTIRILCTIED